MSRVRTDTLWTSSERHAVAVRSYGSEVLFVPCFLTPLQTYPRSFLMFLPGLDPTVVHLGDPRIEPI